MGVPRSCTKTHTSLVVVADELQFTVANASTFSLGHDIVKDHILNLEYQL